MAKKKLFADMLQNPSRFYRVPGDVLRDRRFEDNERAAILQAWAQAADAHAGDVAVALSDLEARVRHAAE